VAHTERVATGVSHSMPKNDWDVLVCWFVLPMNKGGKKKQRSHTKSPTNHLKKPEQEKG
jgi:hypothetical protein